MRRTYSLLAVALLVGCSSTPSSTSSDAGSDATADAADSSAYVPDSCDLTGDAGASRALIGGQCLTIGPARVRVSGVWHQVAVQWQKSDDDTLVVWAEAPAAEAFEVSIQHLRGTAMQQQGYQSWSFSGAVQIPASFPKDADGSIATKVTNSGDPGDEAVGVSYGATLIGNPGGGVTTALGTTRSDTASTAFAVTTSDAGRANVTVLYGIGRESLPADGGVVKMPEVVIAARPSPRDALGVVATAEQKAFAGTARTPKAPSGGWFTWNELFADVTETQVRANLALAKSELAPKGLTLFEIDDGWEKMWGDWSVNAKFPSGMDGVGKAITDAGLTPGVWLAPFLVDVTSNAAKTVDPSFFVKGPDGKPLKHQPAGNTHQYYVLDGTNPLAMGVAGTPIAALRTAGFRFFKLDFLYAGAIHGVRSDPTATGVQALRKGISTLRAAMGDDAVFNACGAPIFPLLGLADSMRVGSDTAFSGASLTWTNVAFAARSLGARAFLSPMVFVDGDQTQVRKPYDDGEAKASAAVAAMAGPAYSLGDDLTKLPADRLALALDPRLLDAAGAIAPAFPDDPLETPAADITASPLLDAIAGAGQTTAPPPTKWTMTGKSRAVIHFTYQWTDTHAVAY